VSDKLSKCYVLLWRHAIAGTCDSNFHRFLQNTMSVGVT
jgi:hypothetical protein